MEELQLKQSDLADVLGGENRVSEILNRKRKLTLEMIRNLTKRLNLSPGLLIHDYLGVDVVVVWKTIHQDIPTLEKLIHEIGK